MKRKSPAHHSVRTHKREGKVIQSFNRGSGSPKQKLKKVVGGSKKTKKIRKSVSIKESNRVGNIIGIDWNKFSRSQFRKGMEVELEHGTHDPQTDVSHNNLVTTGKIAFAHMKELPNYYDLLEKMEAK